MNCLPSNEKDSRVRKVHDLRVRGVSAHEMQKVAVIWTSSGSQRNVLRTKPSQLGRRPDGLATTSAKPNLRLQCRRVVLLAVLCFCAACEAAQAGCGCDLHVSGAVYGCYYAQTKQCPECKGEQLFSACEECGVNGESTGEVPVGCPVWYNPTTSQIDDFARDHNKLNVSSPSDCWKVSTGSRPWFSNVKHGDSNCCIYWLSGSWRICSGTADLYVVTSSEALPPNTQWEQPPLRRMTQSGSFFFINAEVPNATTQIRQKMDGSYKEQLGRTASNVPDFWNKGRSTSKYTRKWSAVSGWPWFKQNDGPFTIYWRDYHWVIHDGNNDIYFARALSRVHPRTDESAWTSWTLLLTLTGEYVDDSRR